MVLDHRVHPFERRVVGDDDMLESRIDGPIEVAQHKDNAPGLDARHVPLHLSRRQSATSVSNRPNASVVLELFEYATHAAGALATIASENKRPIELRMRQRPTLRALERSANIVPLCLAGRIPRVLELRAVLIQAAHLQAASHRHRALRVVLQIAAVEATQAQPGLHVLDSGEVAEICHL